MHQWTEERRKAQAARARANKPWEKSTGPKTEAGKSKVCKNAQKHGAYSEETKFLKECLAECRARIERCKFLLGLKKHDDFMRKHEAQKRGQTSP